LSNTYLWWDSLQAVERTAQRYLRARPKDHGPWDILTRVAAIRGDSALARQHYRRFYEVIDEVPSDYLVRLSLLLEDYDQAEKDAQQLLHSPRAGEVVEGSWFLWIALRNQGRLNEAMTVALQRKVHDPDRLLEALAALDQGDTRKHLAIFDSLARETDSQWSPGIQARIVTWNKMKYAMALSAAGDTVKLRSLADTVETWGQRSLFGRDRRAHHYVRGMLLVARGQDVEAAEEFRQAIHSPTNGFTRVNYELGRALVRLNRAAEAVPVVRAALRGGVDGSNLFMTRTELHELLAQAFDQLGNRDSAAVHYRAVTRAWARSDPAFRTRFDRARNWLVANSPPASSGTQAVGAGRRSPSGAP
jgi:predicted Zn-dependent protease